MAQLRNVAILILVVAAAVLLQSTEAKDYKVGDATGWTSFPPGASSFYSKWAAKFTFKVNDTLVFNFESGSHSVVELTKDNYEKCEVNNNIRAINRGPARITLERPGEFYFSCIFSGHCSSGQKLNIKVTDSSSPAPKKAPAQGPSSSAFPPAAHSVQAEGPSPSASASPPASGLVPSLGSINEGAPSSQTEPTTKAPPPHGSATPLAATFSLVLITIAINFFLQL